MKLEQARYVDADLWNLYDGFLIDSMIIYDSTTILTQDSAPTGCCPGWFVFTLKDSSFDEQFIDQKGSEIFNANWKAYPYKPVPK
ncbi:MAG: hypothetical protein ACI8ZM_000827 [Crocinitomix sp.]|jgi:hypothetical protein